MTINYNDIRKTFTLQTKNSSYQLKIGEFGFVFHTYYGKKINDYDMSYLIQKVNVSFSGNPYDAGADRCFSLDTLPQEYSCFGTGDYRTHSIQTINNDGSYASDLRYSSHKIYSGKYSLEGLPSMYQEEDSKADTLELVLKDKATGLTVILYYGVFEDLDIITRAAKIVNNSECAIKLTKASSLCVDFYGMNMDMISFYGRHGMERLMQRVPLHHGVQCVGSTRGTSSHHYNPFVILCDTEATEEYGNCYGFSLLYSGNFLATAEADQLNNTRLVMGINPEQFCFPLEAQESFTTPEVALTYSSQGLAALSHNYHRAYRNNLCRGKYKKARRPVLINNWEATFFDFTGNQLVDIAKNASELGIELFVMDDGWFGNRKDDLRGLGDWVVNEHKLQGSLKDMVDKINGTGMKFGIWVEPEMVNEDSDLYRAHPDWALQIPGRAPQRSRHQLVLDFSRKEVRDYIYESICKVLESANIEYVKWDMNRNLTDVWCAALPAERQGEVFHRYVLGVYEVLEKITQRFPNILFEGCSGGGGRFDAGILYYFPQSWCSDDTDAIERLEIQYGTSFGYPISSVGSHVSVSPNQQTGRVTPLDTRGTVAMSGTFGYELDISKMTAEEKEIVKQQVKDFKKYYNLIQDGKYYRISNPGENKDYAAWQFVSEDKSSSLVNIVTLHVRANSPSMHIPLKGLAPEKMYRINESEETYLGAALMHGGYPVPYEKLFNDYQSLQLYLTEA